MSADPRDPDPREGDPGDELLGDLAHAFGSLEPERELGRELEQEDATTRAAVEQLRDAWLALEPASSAPPRTARPVELRPVELRPVESGPDRTRRRVAAALVATSLAAAAALLVLLRSRPEVVPSRAPVTELAELEPDVDTPSPVETPVGTPPDEPATPDESERPAPRVEEVRDGQLVVRSGSVRLFLTTGDPARPRPTPRDS